ncbi:MAG: hypothetical protein ACXWH7_09160 [Thermoanaerobaculia bacterium]
MFPDIIIGDLVETRRTRADSAKKKAEQKSASGLVPPQRKTGRLQPDLLGRVGTPRLAPITKKTLQAAPPQPWSPSREVPPSAPTVPSTTQSRPRVLAAALVLVVGLIATSVVGMFLIDLTEHGSARQVGVLVAYSVWLTGSVLTLIVAKRIWRRD